MMSWDRTPQPVRQEPVAISYANTVRPEEEFLSVGADLEPATIDAYRAQGSEDREHHS